MRRRFLKSRDVPNNRIYYLTSDMQKITVRLNPSIGETTSDYGFGSPMVSNEFDGEKFIITCLNNITQIGCYSFNSTNLINIQIPNSVISIESYAFSDCSSLTSIQIPNRVTSIGDYAFRGCSSLSSVIWNSVGCSDFDINYGPFRSCPNITSFTFGDEVEHIPSYLCYNLSSLTSIVIPNSVTSIGDYVFYHCSSLTSIQIPNSVTSIGDSAFEYCTSLTSIQIPNSVTSIGEMVFEYCSNLTSVYIKSTTPPTLGYNVFYRNASGRKIYVPRASLNAYKTASGWSNYASVIEPYDF